MKTKQEILSEIENYVRNYVPPKKKWEFVPVVFTAPLNATEEENLEMFSVVAMIEKTNPSCVGRVVIGMDLTKKSPSIWIGVALLPIEFKDKDYLISQVPFKPIFERAG